MKIRMLVIGAGGFLGSRLMQSQDPRFEMIPATRADCEITKQASVQAAFDKALPDVVVLLAAMADIDRCQNDPSLARKINVTGAENVARECARLGARLIFTSSGAVFDGTEDRYDESDPPSPISVYGQTKADAERVIQTILPNAAIARLSLVLGHSSQPGTNALLDKLQAAFQKATPVTTPVDEYRNAIDAETLTSWLLDMAASQATGIFHLGSSNALSRYEILIHLAGDSKHLVVPQSAVDPKRAPRGRRHFLVPSRILEYSTVPVPTCEQALERSLHDSA